MRRSVDNGRTWSGLQLVSGSRNNYVGNPYGIATSSGRVFLLYVEHNGPWEAIGSGNGVVFSDDDGLTWSRAAEIGSQLGSALGNSPGPGTGIQPLDKRLLVVSHHGAYIESRISYSEDMGKTWATSNHSFPGMDEGTMADLGGGRVLLNMRHVDENSLGRAVARSSDGGLTWSRITYDQALIGPICQGSLAAFGGSVFFSNPASASSRSHLTVRRSDDDGRTWTAQLDVHPGLSFGYSSLVQGPVSDAAHGGILYESGDDYGTIDFRVFPLALEHVVPEASVFGDGPFWRSSDADSHLDLASAMSQEQRGPAAGVLNPEALPKARSEDGQDGIEYTLAQLKKAYDERHAKAKLEMELRSEVKATGRMPAPEVVHETQACSASWENCLDTLCCLDASQRCYAKDRYHGQCRTSCTAGLHPDEQGTQFYTPWTCELLGVPARSLSSRDRPLADLDAVGNPVVLI